MIVFLRRIWTFARPYQGRLLLGLLCGILYALTNGLLVGAIKLVVNLVFAGTSAVPIAQQLDQAPALLRPLAKTIVSWLPQLRAPSSRWGNVLVISTIPVIMFWRVVFAYLNVYLMNWAAVRAVADLRTKLFDHLQNLSLAFFSQARTGELISRISNDTLVLYNVIGNSLASLVRDPITILFLLVLLLSQEPTLTLLSLVVLPVCILPITLYGQRVRRAARTMQSLAAELSTLMHETFTGNRIIKAYNLEAAVLARFRETTSRYVSQMMRVVRASELPSQVMEFLGAVGVALVLVYAVFSARKPGDFVAFITSIFLMYQPFKYLTRLHNQLQQARSASQHVFDLLNTVSTVRDPAAPKRLQAARADIHFENVDFDYGEKSVLRGINLTIKAGQLVALVGSSGSGKTTVTNLLLRFYDPQRGTIRVGSTDIRDVAVKDLRQQIALVTQETILFNDTIRNNIGLGRPGASAAEIEAAARHAHAHDFILEKPEGYETVVGEKGVALSGGQRQRIAIARALLKDAPILVLDEATSSLDTESERAVQAGLEELMAGRTTICIAHRLSTIQKADVIVVLEGGRIVEAGTHTELLEARGVYSKLYELQFEPVEA